MVKYLINVADVILSVNTPNPGIYVVLLIVLPKDYSMFTYEKYTGYSI